MSMCKLRGKKILAAAVLMLIPLLCEGRGSGAGNRGIGFFSSPKGFGASFRRQSSERAFNCYTFYLDTYGVLNGRCLFPGYKFAYSHNTSVARIQEEDICYTFYIGPGVSAGYVREYEPYIYRDSRKYLSRGYGVSAAATASAGCRFEFDGSFGFDLSWTLEAGIFIDSGGQNARVSLYKNGLVAAAYPQVTIFFSF